MLKILIPLSTLIIAVLAADTFSEESDTNELTIPDQTHSTIPSNNHVIRRASPMDGFTIKINGIPSQTYIVGEKLFGEFNLNNISIRNTASVEDNSAKKILKLSTESYLSPPQENKLTLVVLASLNKDMTETDILVFKREEKPYIEKYKGNIILSVVLDRNKTGWNLLEVIEFDSKSSFFELIEDPAYQQGGEIANLSNSIFSPRTSAFIVK